MCCWLVWINLITKFRVQWYIRFKWLPLLNFHYSSSLHKSLLDYLDEIVSDSKSSPSIFHMYFNSNVAVNSTVNTDSNANQNLGNLTIDSISISSFQANMNGSHGSSLNTTFTKSPNRRTKNSSFHDLQLYFTDVEILHSFKVYCK